jgi:hypothetical protein
LGECCCPFELRAKEALGGSCVAPSLKQYVNDVAVLIDGAPEIMALALDVDEHFIEKSVVC